MSLLAAAAEVEKAGRALLSAVDAEIRQDPSNAQRLRSKEARPNVVSGFLSGMILGADQSDSTRRLASYDGPIARWIPVAQNYIRRLWAPNPPGRAATQEELRNRQLYVNLSSLFSALVDRRNVTSTAAQSVRAADAPGVWDALAERLRGLGEDAKDVGRWVLVGLALMVAVHLLK